MAGSSVPAAQFPLIPPLAKIPIVEKTGHASIPFQQFLQSLWAGTQGSGGLLELIQTIYNMSGDATISAQGVIVVASSRGRAFVASAFTDTTDASNISSGTLSSALLDLGSGLGTVAGAVVALGTVPTIFADLPAPTVGARAFITDSPVAASGNFGTAVTTGGGTNKVPLWSEGTGWFIG